MKKLLALFLCLTMMIGALPSLCFADVTAAAKPTREQYRAQQYAGSTFQNTFMDFEDSYANLYYSGLSQDKGFMTGIYAWEAANLVNGPSTLLESGLISQRHMYELAIFDMLDVDNENSVAGELCKQFSNNQASFVFDMCGEVGGWIDVDLTKMSAYEAAQYTDVLKESAASVNMFTAASVIDDIIGAGMNLYEAIQSICNYQAIADMGESTQYILKSIANDTANPLDLRDAAREAAAYMDSSFNGYLQQCLYGADDLQYAVGKTVFSIVVDGAWDKFMTSVGGVAFLAVKGMVILANAVFNLDERNQAFYELKVTVALENALRRTVKTIYSSPSSVPTTATANRYLRGIELYKAVVLDGFDASISLLETQANSGAGIFGWLPASRTEILDLMADIENLKENEIAQYKAFDAMIEDAYCSKYEPNFNETLSEFYCQDANFELDYGYTIDNGKIRIDHYYGDAAYVKIPSEITGYPVTEISSSAFANCDHVISVTMPNSITKIYILAFDDCDMLKTVTLSKNLVELSGYAFRNCPSLQKITLPASLEIVEYQTFKGCTSLSKVTISNGVRVIQNSAFEGCVALKEISIPDSVTEIGETAFSGCSFEKVTIGNGMTSMEAFQFDGNLKEITIGNRVEAIPYMAFYSCSKLASIDIPASVKEIGLYAFYRCTALKTVTLHPGLKTVDYYAFDQCTALECIVLPDTVTYIGDCAFNGCSSLKEVTLSANLKTIGMGAFQECSALTNLSLPEGLTDIGDYTFEGCVSLEELIIPDSVTTIGSELFSGCDKIKRIVIGDGVTDITGVFDDCYLTELETLIYGDGITAIPDREEWEHIGSNSITYLEIGNSVESIGDSAFFCSLDGGATVVIPPSLKTIGKNVFDGYDLIFQISDLEAWCNITHEVPSEEDFFYFYSSELYLNGEHVTDVVIPPSTTDLTMTFAGTDIRSVEIPDSVSTIGTRAFGSCFKLESIRFPDTITAIERQAFEGCRFRELHLPEGLETIGYFAFYCNTRLETLYLPSTLTFIETEAFFDCAALTDVYFNGTRQQWDAIVIGDGNEDLLNATIHFNELAETGGAVNLQFDYGVFDQAASLSSASESVNMWTTSNNITRFTVSASDAEGNPVQPAGEVLVTVKHTPRTDATVSLWVLDDAGRPIPTECVYDEDTYTVTFRSANLNPFILVDNYLCGDLNGDGTLTTSDAHRVLQESLRDTSSAVSLICGDMNADGVINTSDVRRILLAAVSGDTSI